MPRLPHSLLLRAYNISPLLPLVLRGTRTLDSAINELRWLREHVEASKPPSPQASRKRLLHLCKRRSRAEPLQYILGSQPFGGLDIKCRPGVLIPRPETEAYTTHLAELLISGKLDKYLFKPAPENPQGRSFTRTKQLRILDVCSGSGCISLLLHSLLLKSGKFPNIRTLGLDISPQAVALANENLARNIKQGHFPSPKIRNEVDVRQQDEGLKDAFFGRENRLRGKKLEQKKARNAHLAFFSGDRAMHFAEHDIFTPLSRSLGTYSIIISNPPYISSSSFARETTRSVRLYEPKLALVPDPEKYPSLSKKKTRKQSPAIQPSHPDTPPSPSPPSNKHKPHPADIFHQHLLRLSTLCSAKILLMEVGSTTQALRVLHLALSTPRPHNGKPIRYELWRDFPAQEPREGEETEVVVGKKVVPVRGAGRICAVVLVRVPFAVAAEEKQEERNARRTQ